MNKKLEWIVWVGKSGVKTVMKFNLVLFISRFHIRADFSGIIYFNIKYQALRN